MANQGKGCRDEIPRLFFNNKFLKKKNIKGNQTTAKNQLLSMVEDRKKLLNKAVREEHNAAGIESCQLLAK